MDPDDMSDEQLMRVITLAIAAVSGISTTAGGIIAGAKVLEKYIETGEGP